MPVTPNVVLGATTVPRRIVRAEVVAALVKVQPPANPLKVTLPIEDKGALIILPVVVALKNVVKVLPVNVAVEMAVREPARVRVPPAV